MKDLRNRLLRVIAILAALGTFGGCCRIEKRADTGASDPVKIIENNEGFLVTEGEQKILFYQREPKSLDGKYTRSDYVHPLYGLDGEILTEDFPADHPHHRGIFWAWHQIYVGDKKLGDGWSVQDVSWDVYDAKILAVDSRSRALQVQVFWKSPLWTDATGHPKPFVRETTTITVHRAQPDLRKIDFAISLLALEDGVRIGGAENAKAYGGFSTRIKLPDGMEFVGPAGPVEPILTPLPAAPWMDFSGDFDGDARMTGLAILCHESNPGYPHLWILRRKRAMQNPVWPGRHTVSLSREKPITLRYRLIIHRANAHNLNLNKLQAEYNAQQY
ncbi:MAG TPA: DUF6807 family protein [Sedimentisphaerales bacterium]|nr:DUF6807 family protein [Sedimentisphaerales bacterium]